MSREDQAARLTALFLDELQEHLASMNEDLLALESNPADADRLRSLFRSAHTLKGAARAGGVPPVEATCHALEALLVKARDGQLTLGEADFSLLFSAVDVLADAGERLRAGEGLEDAPVTSFARSLRADLARPRHAGFPPPAGLGAEPGSAAVAGREPKRVREQDGRAGRVRLDPEKLDAMLASADELLAMTGRFGDRSMKARVLQDHTGHCAVAWRRLKRSLRPALENPVARRAAEAFDEALSRLAADSDRLASEATEEANHLARLVKDVERRMHGLRMRPFIEACEVLPRTVRDLATAAGKQVRLDISGGDIEADRVVLDAVREALLHLVRNAVDHGIETSSVRRERNKPVAGTVKIAAELRGDRLLVIVEDDGAGLDVAGIRTELQRQGRPVPEEESDLIRALLHGGLSTRAEATSVSGRGVGLDVVRASAEGVRGRVDIAWKVGRWTRFTLDCPLMMSSMRALLVRVGNQIYALPSVDVDRLLRVPPGSIRRADGRDVLPAAEGPVALISLARLLGAPLTDRVPDGPIPVVRLRRGNRRLAVAVDELVAEQELIVRPLEPILRPPPYLAGGALLGTGQVAILLDAAAVVASGLSAPAREAAVPRPASTTVARKRIVLADDSVTTRMLEESILEAAGYDVLTAADGAEAWRILQEQPCDLVISDVEMPGLDGFELCRSIRGSKRLARLPVVLVTALDSPADRARGLDAGADAYIAKSSFDQDELLDAIRRLIG